MNEEERVSYFAIIPANVRYDSELPASAKLLYGEITALSNKKGYCYASNSYFANLYKVSVRTVQLWISILTEKGYIRTEISYRQETKIIDERRIFIAEPHEKNFMTPMKKISPPPRKKFHDPHEKNFMDNNININNTLNNKKNNKKISANAEKESADFELLWSLYPNKKGSKAAAFKSYQKAIKKGVTNETIEKGIHALLSDIQKNHTEKRFIPHGSTWFNQERWNDEYSSAADISKSYEGGENILDELDGLI